jgi:hypothetical protein
LRNYLFQNWGGGATITKKVFNEILFSIHTCSPSLFWEESEIVVKFEYSNKKNAVEIFRETWLIHNMHIYHRKRNIKHTRHAECDVFLKQNGNYVSYKYNLIGIEWKKGHLNYNLEREKWEFLRAIKFSRKRMRRKR